jgi:hypothetical protein
MPSEAYWLVDGLAREQFEGVQRRIAKTFGDADSIIDLCRVMRVPGFWHQKDPARPFQVRIVHEDARLAYKPAEILRTFPPLSDGPKRRFRASGFSSRCTTVREKRPNSWAFWSRTAGKENVARRRLGGARGTVVQPSLLYILMS